MGRKLLVTFGILMWMAWFAGCGIIKVSPLYPQATIIENEDLQASQIFSTEPLFGYRKASSELFTILGDKEKYVGIPVDVFVESAKATPWIKDAIQKLDKDPGKATFDDWYMASRSALRLTKEATVKPDLPLKCMDVAATALCFDPLLIACLPNTEIFISDRPSTYVTQVGGKEVEWVKVEPKAFEAFADSYIRLSASEHLPPSQVQQNFRYASFTMAKYPLLEKAAKFNAGYVTFGIPKIFSSKEKKLILPESMTLETNIYWVEFAVSFRDIDITNIEKIIFAVTAPQDILAMELIPLRFDKEMTITRITSSPEIKMMVGEKAIEIGKVYEQQVVYKSLRPIVYADGLQESEFSWSMMDEAVQPGAKRFIALLQVPKRKKSSTIYFQASAKTKRGLFGIPQGDLISTNPKLLEINFR